MNMMMMMMMMVMMIKQVLARAGKKKIYLEVMNDLEDLSGEETKEIDKFKQCLQFVDFIVCLKVS
jgi:hypothetical protein